jgi:hypothetical protein
MKYMKNKPLNAQSMPSGVAGGTRRNTPPGYAEIRGTAGGTGSSLFRIFPPVSAYFRITLQNPSHKCPQRRDMGQNKQTKEHDKEEEKLCERRIFGPPASLFVGHSPTSGMLPPHASRAAQISRRAICSHL